MNIHLNDIPFGDVKYNMGKFYANAFVCCGLVIVKLYPSVIMRNVLFSKEVSSKFIHLSSYILFFGLL